LAACSLKVYRQPTSVGICVEGKLIMRIKLRDEANSRHKSSTYTKSNK
jgi:hypothetical protein